MITVISSSDVSFSLKASIICFHWTVFKLSKRFFTISLTLLKIPPTLSLSSSHSGFMSNQSSKFGLPKRQKLLSLRALEGCSMCLFPQVFIFSTLKLSILRTFYTTNFEPQYSGQVDKISRLRTTSHSSKDR